ncbi:MAG: NAD-dependent succinate-semialdehyde dehydrogenase, partial [Achromobacter sp.]|nr:NAD-dependent succinate-semialdehyde dehydrogenase [Achromobacter sp.]
MNIATAPLTAPHIAPADGARGLYIGGQWSWPEAGARIPVIDPSSGTVLAEVPDAGVPEAMAAVD